MLPRTREILLTSFAHQKESGYNKDLLIFEWFFHKLIFNSGIKQPMHQQNQNVFSSHPFLQPFWKDESDLEFTVPGIKIDKNMIEFGLI